jgi:3',5'-cyclic AMP phosphodiesterase CpdA
MIREEGNPCKKIEKIIQLAKDTNTKPAFSIITGDISQNGSTSGYKIAQEYISQIESLGGPVLPVMGNVDNRTRFREYLLRELDVEAEALCYYSKVVDGVRVIVLDSQNPGEHTGVFNDEQFDWLEKELVVDYEPTIVALHHPPFKLHLPNGGTHMVFDPESMERFQKIVKNSNVVAVLCGHLHQSLITRSEGVYYIVGCAALSEAFFERKIYRTYDSSGFTQYTLHEDQITVRPVIYTEGRPLIKTRSI